MFASERCAIMLLSSLFDRLDGERLPFCVERNYDTLPERITGDVDLIMPRQALRRAFPIITETIASEGWQLYAVHKWAMAGYWGLYKPEYPGRFVLTIEIFSGGLWKGLSYLDAQDVVEERRRHELGWKPSEAHEALLTSIHHLLYNGRLPTKYQEDVRKKATSSATRYLNAVSRAFGSDLGSSIYEGVTQAKWDMVSALAPRLRTQLFIHSIIREPIVTMASLLRGFIASMRKPDGILIAITGRETGERDELASSLISVADRWHIYLPPTRFAIRASRLRETGTGGIRRAIAQGGVVVLTSGHRDEASQANLSPDILLQLDQRRVTILAKKDDGNLSHLSRLDLSRMSIDDQATVIWSAILEHQAGQYRSGSGKRG